MVQDVGFRVHVTQFKIRSLGFKVQDSEFSRIQIFGFMVLDSGLMTQEFRVGVQGFGFRV